MRLTGRISAHLVLVALDDNVVVVNHDVHAGIGTMAAGTFTVTARVGLFRHAAAQFAQALDKETLMLGFQSNEENICS